MAQVYDYTGSVDVTIVILAAIHRDSKQRRTQKKKYLEFAKYGIRYFQTNKNMLLKFQLGDTFSKLFD